MVKLRAWWQAHRKTVVAAAGALLTVAVALAPGNKWIALAVSAATALGVYGVPNRRAVAAKAPPAVPARTAAKAPRAAGKRGRLPKKPPGQRYAIRYLHEYTGPLPPVTYPIDVSGGITDWGMLGNDRYGDCGFAGRVHYQQAKAAAYGITETFETADDLIAEYLAYDGGQDNGVVLADVLLAWYQAGLIKGFAPVDHSDPSQVDAAMAAFKGVYCGVSLTPDADALFESHQPWTVAQGQLPDPGEGHCILKVKATGQPVTFGGPDLDTWVTWGALQESEAGWTTLALDEAWAIIMHEDEIDPLALARLRADIDALHGTGVT